MKALILVDLVDLVVKKTQTSDTVVGWSFPPSALALLDQLS